MALPREPRQKMINMMYLVLTALLALNVSSEILNAFKTVNRSLENTNTTVNKSTETIMNSLKDKLSDPSTAEKARIWYPKAQEVQNYSKAVYDYIAGMKTQIIKAAGGDYEKGDSTFKEDNLDIPTRLLVEHDGGRTLKKMLEEFTKNILKVDPEIEKQFSTSLPIDLSQPKTRNRGNNTWEAAYFRMVPTVAALTMLSKFQNDVKTSENRVVAYCHNKVGEVVVRFDTYASVVGQSSNYLMPGQELEITAGVGAFSKAVKPQITIGGTNTPIGDDGESHWKTTVNGTGQKTIPVRIVYVDQEGKQQTIERTINYTVGQSNTSIALDKLKVLFIGLDNPITIAASGGAEKIDARISQGSLIKTGVGKFITKGLTEGEATVTVYSDGKVVGSDVFRVRSIPDPTPMVGQKKSGDPMSASEFKSQAGVRAILENFFYETQFNVTSYRITGEGENFDDLMEGNNSGAAWGTDAQRIVARAKKGSIITIDEIRCIGPDGRTRRLPSIVYNLR